jgi:biotin carboxyl carrier protein
MRYFATFAGSPKERIVDLEPLEGSLFRVSVDGAAPKVIDARHLEGHVVHLLVDGKSHEVDLEEDGESLNVLVDDNVLRVDVLDERRRRLKQARGKFSVAGPQTIRAPMPGKIVKILVKAGDSVVEGQGVIIVEAMKMENELRAPKGGKVSGIFVTEGQTVENRANLIAIE